MARDASSAAGDLGLGTPPAAEFTRTRDDLERWRAGDSRAFEDLWRRYLPALEILVRGRIRRRVEAALRARIDAEQVVQDVALTVFGKLSGFDYRGPGSLLAWMSAIAERTLSDWLDYWRAGKRHPSQELVVRPGTSVGETSHGTGPFPADPETGPVTSLAARESRRRLAAAMATLSEREHVIVLWRFFGGASWDEIAAHLGASSADAVRKECCLRVLPGLAVALSAAKGAPDSEP